MASPRTMLTLPRLMAIVDADASAGAGWSMVEFASACLDGGAMLLQIRAKAMSSGALLDQSTTIAARAQTAGARVIVNDRADIARLSGADGVHVGQDDLSPAAVREIVGDGAVVGLSTHTVAQVEAAVRMAVTYIAIGPVFGTHTKSTGYDAVGLEGVRAAASRAHGAGLPLVAIGGITLERAPLVIGAGADTVAVIADLLATGDPAGRVRAYRECLTV